MADKVRAPSFLQDANFLAIGYTYWVCLYNTYTSKFPVFEQFHSQKSLTLEVLTLSFITHFWETIEEY